MKKLMFFLPNFNGGGAEKFLIDLANFLSKKGYKIDFAVGINSGGHAGQLVENINLYDFNKMSTIKCLFSLINLIKRLQPNIIISTLVRANVLVIFAAIVSGVDVKIVVREASEVSGLSRDKGDVKSKILNFLPRYVYKYADAIVAVSDGIVEKFSRFGLNKKISKIPNFVDVVTIMELGKKVVENDIIFADKKIILGVGRLEIEKGFVDLIDAFSLIAVNNYEVFLIILGEGSQRSVLIDRINYHKLTSRVFMPGFVKNPFSYMAISRVYVLPSVVEGFPNSLIQAKALGVPVVSTKASRGCEEILGYGKYGTLVECGDVYNMAKSINDIIERKVYLDDGFKSFQNNYSPDKIIAMYESLFEGLA